MGDRGKARSSLITVSAPDKLDDQLTNPYELKDNGGSGISVHPLSSILVVNKKEWG